MFVISTATWAISEFIFPFSIKRNFRITKLNIWIDHIVKSYFLYLNHVKGHLFDLTDEIR